MRDGQLRRLGGAADHAFLRHRDAVGVADQLALGGGQRIAAGGLDGVENLPDLGFVGLSSVAHVGLRV